MMFNVNLEKEKETRLSLDSGWNEYNKVKGENAEFVTVNAILLWEMLPARCHAGKA